MVTARVCSKLKASWKLVVFTNNVGRILDILWVFLINILLYWMWDDYSQLSASRLVGYLPSHIQRALVEKC